MKKLFKKYTGKNLVEIRRELARAHLIIALLSLVAIVLLTLGSTQPVMFDGTLSAICVILLSAVAFISLCMSVTLFRKK